MLLEASYESVVRKTFLIIIYKIEKMKADTK